MILVTGATGNFGSSTAKYLQEKNVSFRAASNDIEALRKRFGNDNDVDLTTFNWNEPKTFADALKGVDIVYLISPPFTNDFHNKAKPFIEEAKKANVKHIVLTTALFANRPESIFYKTEELIKNSGIGYTIIRPSFLFQNFINYDLQSVKGGAVFAPSAKGKTSYVDVRNIGEASAVILQNPSAHTARVYSITGSEALTHGQMADILSEQLLYPVAHISPDVDDYKKTLAGFNVPDFVYEFMAMLYTTVAQGQWEEVSNDYTLLTGKKPNTFADFIKENQKQFANEKELVHN